MGSLGLQMVEGTLEHEVIQTILKSNEKFDAVILEQFINDGLTSIAYQLGAVPILFSTAPAGTWTNHLIGNPDIPSYIPQIYLPSPIHKDFCQRTKNFLAYIFQKLHDHLYFYPKQNQIVHKYFPKHPHIYDLIHNVSLILFNSNTAYSGSAPLLPNMIEIGGFHVQPPKKLPDDLQKILDNSKDGVIYFSLGTLLNSKDLSPTLRNDILKSFSKLKQTILWKYEDDLPEAPKNVIIRKWFPQSDLLAHRNVKLFITHGGLLSTIESLYRGVPIIGIPVYGDQKLNIGNAVNRGYGVAIDYRELSGETLSDALKEVLENPKYSETAKYGSRIMKDQLTKPLDRAEFWIDYVVRHKGARHFRAASLDLTWYQHISLDVVLFLTAVTIVIFVIFYKIIKWWIGRCRRTKKQKTN
ncbi:UDP-glucosyltransferase [Holotrichia oblita]|uniref:UDP-glucosyltransferase n=1 Tax=Holotrichia oblita TaxID=644536 RepID=A0ACB9T5J4_HOLOL|nr:UDP-glucosyltransferase [Holotrichia oblita]